MKILGNITIAALALAASLPLAAHATAEPSLALAAYTTIPDPLKTASIDSALTTGAHAAIQTRQVDSYNDRGYDAR